MRVIVALLAVLLAPSVHAQPLDTLGVRLTLVADGAERAWPLAEVTAPRDSVAARARQALRSVRREGYYFARLDTVHLDTTAVPPEARVLVTRGPLVEVDSLRLRGLTVLDSAAVRRRFDTRAGRVLDPEALEADLDALLRRYEEAGYPLAQAEVVRLDLGPDGTGLRLTVDVEEGPLLRFARVELEGAARTRPGFAARQLGLRRGAPLTGYRPAVMRRQLQDLGLFRSVGEPRLRVTPDGEAVVVIPVEEAAPGAFDLVLGYLPPPTGSDEGGQVVGSGSLVLRNLFGAGRTASFQLNRLPGQTSRVDVRAADPYIFGTAFGVEAQFEGLQQDSTFNQQRYRLAASYRVAEDLAVFVTGSREGTRPGAVGTRLVGGEQRIPRADAFFFGVGLRYVQLDDVVNPRRGATAELMAEQGRKERSAREVTPLEEGGLDTLRVRENLRQERITATARLFVPTLARQVLVLGADARFLQSTRYDPSDLFRLGGATSLRGYDEEQFRGRFVGRALAEYRYQLDRQAFAFAFFDLGLVERPVIADVPGERELFPGYGFGVQFLTEVGLVTASYAVNPEDGFLSGRVHAGLSFGL